MKHFSVPEIGGSCTPSLSVLDGHIEPSDSLLLVPVDVFRERVSRFLGSLKEHGVERVVPIATRHGQGAGSTAVNVAAQLVGLSLLKVGKTREVVPAGGTFTLPSEKIIDRQIKFTEINVWKLKSADKKKSIFSPPFPHLS